MDIKELRNKKTSELHATLAELRNQLREYKFKVHEGQLKTVDKIKKIKKDIARVLTVIKEQSNKVS